METEEQLFQHDGGEFMGTIHIERVTDGIGFGEGSISHNERRDMVGEEKLRAVEAALETGELVVPIDVDSAGKPVDDDGCGDGRVWRKVFQGVTEKFRSLRRPKVFGGGPAMSTATAIGRGETKGLGLQDAFLKGIGMLKRAKIDFGGHTDSHAHGPNCGCGAIDKAPYVLKNIAKYADKIEGTIATLQVDTTGIDEVLDNFTGYAEELEGAEDDYTGAAVMAAIIDSGKIVKELDGTHNEMFIVLNMIPEHTIDQDKVRELSDGDIQVFVVDVWRAAAIADRLYADETAETRHKAFLSELIYTLGVAATLTKGDLPVYVASATRKATAV